MSENTHAPTVDGERVQITDGFPHGSRSRHLFVASEDTALCGHPSTKTHDRTEAPAAVLGSSTAVCGNCAEALLGESREYVSGDETFNTAREIEVGDEVRVEVDDGREFFLTITESGSRLPRKVSVSGTTAPEKPPVARDVGEKEDEGSERWRLRFYEGEESEIVRVVWGDEEGDVVDVEIVGEYDANPDEEAKEELAHRLDRRAAEADRKAEAFRDEGRDDAAEYTEIKAAALRGLSRSLRRHPLYTLEHARREAEWRVEHGEERFENAEGDEHRKEAGRLSGRKAALAEVCAMQREEAQADADDVAADGGSTPRPTGVGRHHGRAEAEDRTLITDGGERLDTGRGVMTDGGRREENEYEFFADEEYRDEPRISDWTLERSTMESHHGEPDYKLTVKVRLADGAESRTWRVEYVVGSDSGHAALRKVYSRGINEAYGGEGGEGRVHMRSLFATVAAAQTFVGAGHLPVVESVESALDRFDTALSEAGETVSFGLYGGGDA